MIILSETVRGGGAIEGTRDLQLSFTLEGVDQGFEPGSTRAIMCVYPTTVALPSDTLKDFKVELHISEAKDNEHSSS